MLLGSAVYCEALVNNKRKLAAIRVCLLINKSLSCS